MNKKIIITVGIILVLMVLLGISYLQKNKQAVNNETPLVDKNNSPCLDSDGGKNIYTKGSAVYKDAKGITLHITSDSCAMKNENKQAENEVDYTQGLPSCTGSNCYIFEGYCGEYQGSPIDAREFIQCQNGCSDGACISDSSLNNKIYQCNADDDCILVSTGNCCNFIAVNKNFKDEIKSTQMICMRVCYMEPTCNNSICQVTKN